MNVCGNASILSLTADKAASRAGEVCLAQARHHPRLLQELAQTIFRGGIHGIEASAASSYVCLVDDAAESFVVGVVVAPDDVPADHAGLFLVAGVVGAVQREVPQRRELRLDAV